MYLFSLCFQFLQEIYLLLTPARQNTTQLGKLGDSLFQRVPLSVKGRLKSADLRQRVGKPVALYSENLLPLCVSCNL